MKYFSYGSNMNMKRMTIGGILFTSRQSARLSGYKLNFNKKSSKGKLSCANITKEEESIVEGAMYELPDTEIGILDRHEGYPKHYDRIKTIEIDLLVIYKNSLPALYLSVFLNLFLKNESFQFHTRIT